MRNAGQDELQAGIKTGARNINNLRYVDDTTLKAESEEELKSLLMRVKEESEKTGLKLNVKKLRSCHLAPFSSVQFSSVVLQKEEKVEVVTDFLFLGSNITVGDDCSH